MPNTEDFIASIVQASLAKKLVIFCGAGLSAGSGLPLWSALLQPMAAKIFPKGVPAGADLTEIADIYADQVGEAALRTEIVNALRAITAHPNAAHDVLPRLRPAAVFTTNYDDLLHEALRPLHSWRITRDDDAVGWRNIKGLPVFHLHGHVERCGEMVITRSDYLRYAESHSRFLHELEHFLEHGFVLFLGYGAGDPHFEALCDLVARRGSRMAHCHAAIVLDNNDPLFLARLRRMKAVVHSLEATSAEATGKLAAFLAGVADAIEQRSPSTGLVSAGHLQYVMQSLLRPQAFPPNWTPPGVDVLAREVPPDEPKWVGREEELQQLRDALLPASAPEARPVAKSLTSASGRGGIGKSALAARFAHLCLAEHRDRFPEGVLWYRVGTRTLPHTVEEISRLLRLTSTQQLPMELRMDHLTFALSRMQVLVVLDNLDMPDRWPPLERLFRGQSILITTRESLDHVINVCVDRLPGDKALDLFKKHAGISGTARDQELRPFVRNFLDGVPLAIELAGIAFKENGWTVPGMAQRIQAKIDVIDRLVREENDPARANDLRRNSSVRASFLISWDAVQSPLARELFALASVFQGKDFAEKQLVALGSEALKTENSACETALRELKKRHMVEILPGEGERLQIFPLLRQFADELRRELQARLPESSYLPVLAQQFRAELKGNTEFGREELANVEGLLGYYLQEEDWPSLRPLLESFFWSWYYCGLWEPCLDWLRKTAVAAEGAEAAGDLAAWCRMEEGDILNRKGQHGAALAAFGLARKLYELHPGDQSSRLRGWIQYWEYSSRDSTGADGEESLCARLQGLRCAHHRDVMSNFNYSLEKFPSAREWIDTAALGDANLLYWRLVKISSNEARALDSAAQRALLTGETAGIPRLLEEGRQILAANSDAEVTAELAATRGDYEFARGRHSEAHAAWKDSHDLRTELGATEQLAWLKVRMAEALAADGLYEEALCAIGTARETFTALQIPAGQAECTVLAAEIALTRTDTALTMEIAREARTALDQAATTCHHQGLSVLHLRVELLRGLLHAENGDPAAAAEKLALVCATRQHLGVKPHRLLALEVQLRQKTENPAAPAALPPPLRLSPTWIHDWPALPERRTADDGMEMILIPSGWTTTHGDEGDWQAWLPPYYIDPHPVTNGQYERFCRDTGHALPHHWHGQPPPPAFDRRPITGITLADAQDYARHYGKTLPTVWEWLTAVRGREAQPFPWGNDWRPDVLRPVPSLTLGDYSYHPLTQFDAAAFRRLLEGSLSLSLAEKRHVIEALPMLSQYQVDELIKVFQEEIAEFENLQDREAAAIAKLQDEARAQMAFADGFAPLDVGHPLPGTDLLDGMGLVRERLANGLTIGYEAGLQQNPKKGLWASVQEDRRGAEKSPEHIRINLVAGFRCLRPMIGADAMNWALPSRRYA